MNKLTFFLLPVLQLPPLTYASIAFIAGIACQASCYPYYPFLCAGTIIVIYSYHTATWRPFFMISFCVAGAFSLWLQQYNHERCVKTFYNTTYTCVARVDEITKVDHKFACTRVTLRVKKLTAVDRPDNSFTPNSSIYIYCSKTPDVQVGDTVEIKQLTFKKEPNGSFADYLIKENITATIFLPSMPYTLVARPYWSPRRWVAQKKATLLQKSKQHLHKKTQALFSSIFLGNRHLYKKELRRDRESFATWGILHYLARSGLHLLVILFVWSAMLSFVPLSLFVRRLLMLALCITYYLLSWSSVAFNRALLSYLLYIGASLLHVRSNFLHLLSLTCLLILVRSPMQLFFLDFQLSFGLTFALAFLSHIESFSSNK